MTRVSLSEAAFAAAAAAAQHSDEIDGFGAHRLRNGEGGFLMSCCEAHNCRWTRC